MQQRVCIKLCVKNIFNGAQTLEMLEKYFGNDTLTRSNVFRWYERFRSGRESVKDDERSGKPSTATTNEKINKIKGWMTVSRKLTIREIAEEFNIAYWSAQEILFNDLGLRGVAAKLVPKVLNFMQKRDRNDVAKDMLSKVDSDPAFIKWIINGDETWIYEYDTHSRHQASDEPRPKNPRLFQLKKKVMLTVFMDYSGVVHHEFLPEGQTVNKEYYLSVIRRLCEEIRQERSDLWANNSWILHHDNAPSYSAIIVREHLGKNETNTIQKPPKPPHLAPCDFFLSGWLKKPLRETRYSARDEVMEKSKMALMSIPQTDLKKMLRGLDQALALIGFPALSS